MEICRVLIFHRAFPLRKVHEELKADEAGSQQVSWPV